MLPRHLVNVGVAWERVNKIGTICDRWNLLLTEECNTHW